MSAPDDLPPGLQRTEDGEGPAKLTLAGEIETAKKLATASVLTDYSQEVLALDQDTEGAVVWQSAELEDFGKNGKINFLRITDAGFVILDVFKPGRHFVDQKFVGPEVAQEIKQFLTQSPFNWTTKGSSWKRKNGQLAESSDPDAIFKFTRFAQVSSTHKLVWKGKHTNPAKAGMPFKVEDTLEFEFV
jgi:hypothetical protein